MPRWLLSLLVVSFACSRSGDPEPGQVRPLPSAAASKPAPDACPARRELDAIVDEWLAHFPRHARALGLHAYDGKIGDHSSAGIANKIAWLRRTSARLSKLDAGTDPDCILDRRLEQQAVELALFELVDRDEWRKDPRFYSELFGVEDYLDREYAPLDVRASKLLAHEQAALAQVAHIERNLSAPLPKPVLETAIKIFKGYAGYLRGDVVTLVGRAGDADFQKRFRETNSELAKAADRVVARLSKELARADQSYRLGPDRYRRLLELQEGLTLPLTELEAMANEDLARNARAFAELAAKTRDERPEPDRVFAEAEKLVTSAREFVVEKDLLGLPEDRNLVVKETPPYMRWNQAFLNAPGPFENAGTRAFYYITLPDKTWPKREQAEYILPFGVLVATTVHEVFPGHFVQGKKLERAPTRPQKVFESYSFVEGWAHYTEQLMIEQGFFADRPEARLGQLSDALLRNCRFVASIGLHAKNMSLEEAETLFAKECRQDRATAREQAVRGTFDPGYFAYTLGKLQILKLRERAQKRLGARFSLRRFHDALLSHGAPPIPWIEERVISDLEGAP